MIFSLLASALAASASAASCAPVAEADTLWQSAATRWVVVGELHGTNETPDAFANLVCLAAAKRGPVSVALEYPQDMQPVLDAWLASDGGDAARIALLAAPMWHRTLQDGRTSTAFLRLFERLRTLHAAGKVAALRGFDVPSAWRGKTDRNADMAAELTRIADRTAGLTLVLVGNVHAMRAPITFGTTTVRPATFLLPESKRVSVDVESAGGTNWACQQDGCHIQTLPIHATRSVGIAWLTAPERRFDVIYILDVPFTAAEPAIAGVANTAPPDKVRFIP